MQLLAQSFSLDGRPLPDPDREELKNLLAAQLGISPEAARAAHDQWQRVWSEGVVRFEAAKEEAKRVAQNAAAIAAKRTSQASIAAFFAMIVGLGAAIAGALCGSACATACFERRTATHRANRVP